MEQPNMLSVLKKIKEILEDPGFTGEMIKEVWLGVYKEVCRVIREAETDPK